MCKYLSSDTYMYIINALNDKVATATPYYTMIHPSLTHSCCLHSNAGVEVSGVWTGPVHAARAIRSLSPACAAPVVPPYTALGGAHECAAWDITLRQR